eukprot:1236919-Pleurochrysis_carterae.AAC.1
MHERAPAADARTDVDAYAQTRMQQGKRACPRPRVQHTRLRLRALSVSGQPAQLCPHRGDARAHAPYRAVNHDPTPTRIVP